jgi:hypothetical protein
LALGKPPFLLLYDEKAKNLMDNDGIMLNMLD